MGTYGYLAFRVTNTPFQTPYKLVPPFQQVLVQSRKPVPGQVYNVLRCRPQERDVANVHRQQQFYRANDESTAIVRRLSHSLG